MPLELWKPQSERVRELAITVELQSMAGLEASARVCLQVACDLHLMAAAGFLAAGPDHHARLVSSLAAALAGTGESELARTLALIPDQLLAAEVAELLEEVAAELDWVAEPAGYPFWEEPEGYGPRQLMSVLADGLDDCGSLTAALLTSMTAVGLADVAAIRFHMGGLDDLALAVSVGLFSPDRTEERRRDARRMQAVLSPRLLDVASQVRLVHQMHWMFEDAEGV